MGGEAIGGHDVEADAGEQHDARFLRLGVARGEGFEDRDLAGDVEVMRLGADAGVGHRLGRRRERAREVEHGVDRFERGVELRFFAKVEGAPFQTEFGRERFDFFFAASGENGLQALRLGRARGQFAGVTGRAVDQELRRAR